MWRYLLVYLDRHAYVSSYCSPELLVRFQERFNGFSKALVRGAFELHPILRPVLLTRMNTQGAVVPVVSAEPLGNVNKVLDDLRASRVTGRKVIVPSLGHH